MLATMNSERQKQHENMNAFDMIVHLKRLYQEQARHERPDVFKTLIQCRMEERSLVGVHVLKMIWYIENLKRLGFPLGQELAMDLILQSLPKNYNQFVRNYSMNEIEKTLPKLLSMLKTIELNLKKLKPSSIMMVRKGR